MTYQEYLIKKLLNGTITPFEMLELFASLIFGSLPCALCIAVLL